MKICGLFIQVMFCVLIMLLLSACAIPAELPAEVPSLPAETPADNPLEAPLIDEPLLEDTVIPEDEIIDEPVVEIASEFRLPEAETVNFYTEDGLTVTADLYKTANAEAPYILLFHQAAASRGEYFEIAPRLNVLGFNCLAVDQRSGDISNGLANATASVARKIGLETEYEDTLPDLRAALIYAKEELRAQRIIIWGSSYSAALAVILANEFPNEISAMVAFSPGEYFEFAGQKVRNHTANITCPSFIAAETAIESQAKAIFNNIPAVSKEYCSIKGHGSSVLWSNNADNELYWQQVIVFLGNIWNTARF